jgi:hypothetical protein
MEGLRATRNISFGVAVEIELRFRSALRSAKNLMSEIRKNQILHPSPLQNVPASQIKSNFSSYLAQKLLDEAPPYCSQFTRNPRIASAFPSTTQFTKHGRQRRSVRNILADTALDNSIGSVIPTPILHKPARLRIFSIMKYLPKSDSEAVNISPWIHPSVRIEIPTLGVPATIRDINDLSIVVFVNNDILAFQISVK